jgi:DNA topoisomerase-1
LDEQIIRMLQSHFHPKDVAKEVTADNKRYRRAAKSAGLRYISDDIPGITRHRSGKSFLYRSPKGKRISDRKLLSRIKALAIPPAWRDVWIAPSANSHLTATGRDTKGRKQYRYHPDFSAMRDTAKYEHLAVFARALTAIRKSVRRDLSRKGLPREKVLAAVVALLEESHIRIGNEDYARANGSFGLTTLRNRHVKVKGAESRFTFRGKSGKVWHVALHDRRVARIIRGCQDLPGQHLFEYLAADGTPQTISSGDVNDYLRTVAGHDVTAKDFRTWHGTVAAAQAFQRLMIAGKAPTQKATKAVVDDVAALLGNTAAVCRKCYIHPRVIDAFAGGKPMFTARTCKSNRLAGLSNSERAVLAFLES